MKLNRENLFKFMMRKIKSICVSRELIHHTTRVIVWYASSRSIDDCQIFFKFWELFIVKYIEWKMNIRSTYNDLNMKFVDIQIQSRCQTNCVSFETLVKSSSYRRNCHTSSSIVVQLVEDVSNWWARYLHRIIEILWRLKSTIEILRRLKLNNEIVVIMQKTITS